MKEVATQQGKLRDHRAGAVAALIVVMLVAGFAPRNQRALFATMPFGTPEAFTAIVPPPSQMLYGGGGPGNLFYPRERGGPGGIGDPDDGGFGGGPGDRAGGLPPTGPEIASATGLPELIAPPGGGTAGGPPVELPGGGTTAGPGDGGGTPGGGDPGGGGGSSGGDGPLPGGVVPPPATPVPEPGTWAMMIVGVMVLGGAMRRLTIRRARRRPAA